MLLKSLLAWFIILLLAIGNGALREALLIPLFGNTAGLVLSGLLLSLLILAVAYGFVRVLRGITIAQAVRCGIAWLCLTLVFEFSFGHYVQHKTWGELLEAYTFRDGNLWPLVLLVTLLAPALAARYVSANRD